MFFSFSSGQEGHGGGNTDAIPILLFRVKRAELGLYVQQVGETFESMVRLNCPFLPFPFFRSPFSVRSPFSYHVAFLQICVVWEGERCHSAPVSMCCRRWNERQVPKYCNSPDDRLHAPTRAAPKFATGGEKKRCDSCVPLLSKYAVQSLTTPFLLPPRHPVPPLHPRSPCGRRPEA